MALVTTWVCDGCGSREHDGDDKTKTWLQLSIPRANVPEGTYTAHDYLVFCSRSCVGLWAMRE